METQNTTEQKQVLHISHKLNYAIVLKCDYWQFYDCPTFTELEVYF